MRIAADKSVGGVNLNLVIEEVAEGKVFAGSQIQGVQYFGLGIKSQSSALCGTRDHFVRKLLC